MRTLHMRLQRQHALSLGGLEQLVKHQQQVWEGAFSIGVSLEQPQALLEDPGDHDRWVPDEHGPQGRAADDDELRNLDENANMPMVHRIAEEHTAKNDAKANDDEHVAPLPVLGVRCSM